MSTVVLTIAPGDSEDSGVWIVCRYWRGYGMPEGWFRRRLATSPAATVREQALEGLVQAALLMRVLELREGSLWTHDVCPTCMSPLPWDYRLDPGQQQANRHGKRQYAGTEEE